MRHTDQSLEAATGANLKDLKKRFGQSCTAASKRYMHVLEGRDAQIAETLSKLANGADASKLPKSF